jgi:hypothetical protein
MKEKKELLLRRDPAVDLEFGRRHEARLVGGKIEDRKTDIFRFAEALQGDLSCQLVLARLAAAAERD